MGDADAFRPSDEDPMWRLVRDRLNREDDWSDVLVGDQIQAIRRAVTAQLVDIEAQLASARAQREEFRQQCFDAGQAGKREWFESIEPFEQWRKRALHFHRLLKARIARLKYAEQQDRVSRGEGDAQFYRDIVRQLTLAIAGHDDEVKKPGPADVRLWSTLQEIKIPLGTRMVTLETMLEIWYPNDEPAE